MKKVLLLLLLLPLLSLEAYGGGWHAAFQPNSKDAYGCWAYGRKTPDGTGVLDAVPGYWYKVANVSDAKKCSDLCPEFVYDFHLLLSNADSNVAVGSSASTSDACPAGTASTGTVSNYTCIPGSKVTRFAPPNGVAFDKSTTGAYGCWAYGKKTQDGAGVLDAASGYWYKVANVSGAKKCSDLCHGFMYDFHLLLSNADSNVAVGSSASSDACPGGTASTGTVSDYACIPESKVTRFVPPNEVLFDKSTTGAYGCWAYGTGLVGLGVKIAPWGGRDAGLWYKIANVSDAKKCSDLCPEFVYDFHLLLSNADSNVAVGSSASTSDACPAGTASTGTVSNYTCIPESKVTGFAPPDEVAFDKSTTGAYGCWLYGDHYRGEGMYLGSGREDHSWVKVANVSNRQACYDLWASAGGYGGYILTNAAQTNPVSIGSSKAGTTDLSEALTGCANAGGAFAFDATKCDSKNPDYACKEAGVGHCS